MFQQQDLQGLGSEARAAVLVLAFTSCVALINLLDHTEFFFFVCFAFFFFSVSKISCAGN